MNIIKKAFYMRTLIFFLCFVTSFAHAVDLSNINLKALHGTTIAYYFGSFDPFHNGHMEVVQHLKERADYVLVVPGGVADKRKPNRTDPHLRREVIGEIFAADPQVLTSQLNPLQIQQLLAPYVDGIHFVGVQGTEILDEFENASQKALDIYLSGNAIPAEKADTAVAAMMMVKADELFVPLRDPESPWAQRDMFHEFTLHPIHLSPNCGINSSTDVRAKVRGGEPYEHLIPPAVASHIRKYELYEYSKDSSVH